MAQTQLCVEFIEYKDGQVLLEGCAVYDKNALGKRPIILVAHSWEGRNDFSIEKALELAKLGYVGFALDMYGKNMQGTNSEENSKLMAPFLQDRAMLRSRVVAALDPLSAVSQADISRVGAIGYCFGGLCVLDLARSGANLKGVVSFHGRLLPAPSLPVNVKAKILAFHGYNDPLVPLEEMLAFEKEMNDVKADWQVHVYGNTTHGFTNPRLNDPSAGLMYNAIADKRSWQSMQNFFAEVFA